MSERPGVLRIGVDGKHVITAFIPPLPETMLFEAKGRAFALSTVLHHESSGEISGLVYDVGDPYMLSARIKSLREQVEDSTGYVADEKTYKVGKEGAAVKLL